MLYVKLKNLYVSEYKVSSSKDKNYNMNYM